jgi:hypothetical protein
MRLPLHTPATGAHAFAIGIGAMRVSGALRFGRQQGRLSSGLAWAPSSSSLAAVVGLRPPQVSYRGANRVFPGSPATTGQKIAVDLAIQIGT